MNLQEQYEKESGLRAYEYGGIPKREYVEWLESQLEWIPVEERLPEDER